MRKTLVVVFGLSMAMACQKAWSDSPKQVSAGALDEQYQRSSAEVRSKYDGKEISVRGYVSAAPTIPGPGDDQGSVSLEEEGRQPLRQVTCWFSKDQAAEFSKIRGAQYITVKGIFNGEVRPELRFCKLLKIE
jgi:hypothetical protein